MKVAVLGAGIQGCCLALELARRGVQVDLYDRNLRPFTQASLCNEAKVHLGFFYGNASSPQTVRLIMQGALHFQPLLRRWLGDGIDAVPVSRPYVYAVHRDSLVAAPGVEAHLRRTSQLIAECAGPGREYFGLDPAQSPEPVAIEEFFDPAQVVAAYQTPEVAISADALGNLLRDRLQREPNVTCRMNALVVAATPADAYATVEFESAGERLVEGYDHVVNALWDGRLQVDATAGVTYEHPWLFRTKYNLHLPAGTLQEAIPSVSFVLGAFGDIVQCGSEAYLSWYPAGLKAMTSDLQPAPFSDRLAGTEAVEVAATTFDSLTCLIPGLRTQRDMFLTNGEVRGGVIFAWGDTDITDPRSELHSRHDVGPRSYGRYHSIDTGKFTLAPLFAVAMADALVSA